VLLKERAARVDGERTARAPADCGDERAPVGQAQCKRADAQTREALTEEQRSPRTHETPARADHERHRNRTDRHATGEACELLGTAAILFAHEQRQQHHVGAHEHQTYAQAEQHQRAQYRRACDLDHARL
jgi:hypothetical protein